MYPCSMYPASPTSPDLSHRHRIRRKPPPSLDVSERYPPPDPLDPFAPLWVLRNRTSSGLSRQDVLESSRTRSSSYLYSTTTAKVSVNTSISPIYSSSPRAKNGHYRSYSQATFIDSPQAFPLISSPLASQPDLLYRQHPFPDRRTSARSPRQTLDMNDSSETESDTTSIPFPHKAAFIQPRRTASSNYHFPKFLLLKKASFLGSGNAAIGNRSSMIELKQLHKPNTISSPPIVSTLAWVPNPVSSDSINGQSATKFTTSLFSDLPNCGTLSLTSDEKNHHRNHQHHKRYPITSDSSKDLKQDLPRPRKFPSISISPKMLRKRISSGRPFSFNIARTRSISSSSYVHISTPTPVPSCSQPTSEDAYTSPRKAPVPPPVPPPVSSTVQEQVSKACPDKSCGDDHTHSISSEWDPPSPLQLNYAANLSITGEDGKDITFGSLFESQRTIVIFIRHFWCPLCQDYMSAVKSFVRPEMICNTSESGNHHHHRSQSQNKRHDGATKGSADNDAGTRIRIVVISNGAHSMIAKYKQIFALPFKVYTDPTLALYQALGMGKDGDVKQHHNHQTHKHSTSKGSSSDVISEKNSDMCKHGGYVKHSLMGGIAMVILRALRVCMPVWEKGGDVSQLGGEFVFGPGLTCAYAHRMQTTKGHAPIQDVVQAASIPAPNRTSTESRREQPVLRWRTSLTSKKGPRKRRGSMSSFRNKENCQVKRPSSRRHSICMISQEDEDLWMEYRQNSIELIQERKDMRRGINRATSSQSHSSRQHHRQFLEMMGEMSDDHREVERGQIAPVIEDSEGERPSPTRKPRRHSMHLAC